MSHSQFHCNGRAYLDLHGLIFETSICYWQDQPGSLRQSRRLSGHTPVPRGTGTKCGERHATGVRECFTDRRHGGFEKIAFLTPVRHGQSPSSVHRPTDSKGENPTPTPWRGSCGRRVVSVSLRVGRLESTRRQPTRLEANTQAAGSIRPCNGF